MSGQAVWDENARGKNAPTRYGKLALTSNVSAASTVTCNEKKYNSDVTAWAEFGLNVVRGHSGLMDLFK